MKGRKELRSLLTGQVGYVTKTPLSVVADVTVSVVDSPPGSVTVIEGGNVKVSPSVVTTTGVVKPVGTVTVLVPHSNLPEEEVTTIPSERV